MLGREALDELVDTGFVRVPGYLSEQACARLHKPDSVAWRAVAPKVGVVSQHGWFLQMAFGDAPDPVQAAGSSIHGALAGEEGSGEIPPFNEVSWQRYDPANGFIGPHRDQAYYVGVIAVVTLQGRAEFAVLESRDPPVVIDRWTTCTGDLVLLRGTGLGLPGSRGPIHRVGPPDAERLSLSFRHNRRGPGGWSEA